jgi:hypothetical protein
MSHHDQHGHGDDHDHKAADEINYVKVIGVGVVSLLIFAISTVWAARILSRETERAEQTSGKARAGVEIGKPEIGIVDQVPFIVDRRLGAWREVHNAKLNGYGWIDRGKGIAHIPIERAMDAVASGALPMGAPR